MRSLSSYLYVVVYVAAQSVAVAQQTATFGLVSDFKTLRRSRIIVNGDFNGDGLQDIGVVSDGGISIYAQLADSVGFRIPGSPFTIPQGDVLSCSIDGDRYADLVILSRNPVAIHALAGKGNGTFTERWSRPLSGRDYRCAVADINNDGKNDIIVYSRREPGITVYPGTGTGQFRPAQPILSDVPFANVVIADCNDDKLNDVIGVNWISNEVNVFVSFGRMKYGNPSVISFSREPSFIAPAQIDSNNTLDLFVGFEDQKMLQVYAGDGFGGFEARQTIGLDAIPSRVVAHDIDGNGKSDFAVLSADEKSLDVWLNNGEGRFDDHVDFAAGKSPAELLFLTGRSRREVDAAILDTTSSRMRILFPAGERLPKSSDASYCTGLSPVGIASIDFNRDGKTDIVVSDMGSMAYSIFRNNGFGGFNGQVSFPVVMNPTRVWAYARPDTTSMIVLGGRFEDRAFIGTVTPGLNNVATASISTQPDPLFLGMVTSSKPGFYDLFAQEFERSTQKTFLTKFEQVASRRYSERNYTPALPLLAASVSQRQGRGEDNLFLMTFDARRKACYIYRTDANDARRSNPVSVLTMAAPVKPTVTMWSYDVNRDGRDDLLINLRQPDNTLMIALAEGDSSFAQPVPIFSDEISISNRDGLRVADMNNDGIPDLVVDNDIDKSIQTYLGKGKGEFAPKLRLISSVGTGGFEVADMNGDGLPELIVLDTAEGLLRIIHLNQ